jgi:hypothetical protein
MRSYRKIIKRHIQNVCVPPAVSSLAAPAPIQAEAPVQQTEALLKEAMETFHEARAISPASEKACARAGSPSDFVMITEEDLDKDAASKPQHSEALGVVGIFSHYVLAPISDAVQGKKPASESLQKTQEERPPNLDVNPISLQK